MFCWDIICLQLFIILLLSALFFSKDNFYLILNSILFLLAAALYMWICNLDIFVNFLVIIDLGVFFTLLGFTLNLVNMFGSVTGAHKLLSIFWAFALILIFGTAMLLTSDICSLRNLNSLSYPLSISFFDWYSLYTKQFSSDLQILSDIYFKFNFIEFVIMNLLLYVGIVTVFAITNFKFWKPSLKVLSRNIKESYGYFAKSQSFQNQINQTITVRIWNNKSPLRDTKTDLNSINR